MTVDEMKSRIIRKGICLYAGVKKYAVYICKDHTLYGTGDYEDEHEIAGDCDVECYTVYFSDLLDQSKVCASAGQYANCEAAVEAAENSGGFLKWEVCDGQ